MTEHQLTIFFNLIIAHLLSDFIFQTKKMVENKSWVSKEMTMHISIVFLTSAIFSFLWWQTLILALSHYLIDGMKIELKKRKPKQEVYWFLFDQILHLAAIGILCCVQFSWCDEIIVKFNEATQNSKFALVLLAYVLVTYPIGYLIGLMTKDMSKKKNPNEDKNEIAKNGLRIGIFERIIILTFVLLNQYEAIGFLITGKSLLRFASKDESTKSEYVLLGTMMSYAITIGIGVILVKFGF